MRHHESFVSYDRIVLQREWPIRRLRYRWRPSQFIAAGYAVTHADGLDVRVARDRQSVLVEADELPGVPEEPHMPPEHAARASIIFFYTDGELGKDYWEREARRVDAALKTFCRDPARLLATLGLAGGSASLETLRAAYDWIDENVTHTGLRSFEEIEAAASTDEPREGRGRGALRVLEARRGGDLELAQLFICAARALGADARLVLAPDRRWREWEQGFASLEQFDAALVAVGAPGASEVVIADPGSGLPFGDVPWWFTRTEAFMPSAGAALSLGIPPAPAQRSVARADVLIEFREDTAEHVQWTWRGGGQTGLALRTRWRDAHPQERERELERRCGGSRDAEVLQSQVTGLERDAAELRLFCEFQREGVYLDDVSHYTVPWAGPWLGHLPELPPGPRVHPIVLDFPRIDIAHVRLHAPVGFTPGAAPSGARVTSPYGTYETKIAVDGDAFVIDRALALLVPDVPATEYDTLREFIGRVEEADRSVVTFERTLGDR
jgi:hypothetical protein